MNTFIVIIICLVIYCSFAAGLAKVFIPKPEHQKEPEWDITDLSFKDNED